ncbi:hypothetical protein Fcan01_11735 [Folsomia candida]|uniref:Uncharacterized protein n=1 Tax=Folsomia candida TaxID=158441 RepID=A0A226EBE3_FOLCA|nr:hypothetical protein Fcan01_11735 [Folsomia candida]
MFTKTIIDNYSSYTVSQHSDLKHYSNFDENLPFVGKQSIQMGFKPGPLFRLRNLEKEIYLFCGRAAHLCPLMFFAVATGSTFAGVLFSNCGVALDLDFKNIYICVVHDTCVIIPSRNLNFFGILNLFEKFIGSKNSSKFENLRKVEIVTGGGPQIPISEKIAIYQKFQILTTYYNEASIWLLAPVLCVFIPAGLVISCAFASIGFHSFLPFFEYLPFPVLSNNGVVILAVTLLPSAAIYEASNKLCLKIRAEGKPEKVLRRRIFALHPFGVRIGAISKIRKIAILLSYNFIANYIFTLLITFPAEKVTR